MRFFLRYGAFNMTSWIEGSAPEEVQDKIKISWISVNEVDFRIIFWWVFLD